MKYLLLCCLLLPAITGHAQTYTEQLARHRAAYKLAFVTDTSSPLKADDTAYLRFFEPDKTYRVTASFQATPKAEIFDMPTRNGSLKKYRKYGVVTFSVHDTTVTLEVYQSPVLMKKPGLKDYLFVPFRDGTNYAGSYGGGRYLELRTGDIRNGKVILDFNRCYNPYCAYAEGYACPIPPDANRLPVSIPAGEMNFEKPDMH